MNELLIAAGQNKAGCIVLCVQVSRLLPILLSSPRMQRHDRLGPAQAGFHQPVLEADVLASARKYDINRHNGCCRLSAVLLQGKPPIGTADVAALALRSMAP